MRFGRGHNWRGDLGDARDFHNLKRRVGAHLMLAPYGIFEPEIFAELLYEKIVRINAGISKLELCEFRYALDNLYPKPGGWAGISLESTAEIERQIQSSDFYIAIQVKPRWNGKIVLDPGIVHLTNMLLVGLVSGAYSEEWVNAHFYFDVRGFFFLVKTVYFTKSVVAHLGGKPFKQFEQKQKQFECDQGIGYQQFQAANAEVDGLFIASVKRLIAAKGTPIVLAIAGPTAAGKTEIVMRLREAFERAGKCVTSIEMDNFLTDREPREEKGIDSLGREAIHLALFRKSLEDICRGYKISIPRYNFILGTSSHDLSGKLKPGCSPIEIEPADVIFIEGNFPFLIEEVVHLIGIKVVYLTDDAVRLKRKWKRDIDYRKKYDPAYFCNRFFKDQFLMAQKCYRPQMQVCDMVVDTTGAALWTTLETSAILSGKK
jgi:uridine kinase